MRQLSRRIWFCRNRSDVDNRTRKLNQLKKVLFDPHLTSSGPVGENRLSVGSVVLKTSFIRLEKQRNRFLNILKSKLQLVQSSSDSSLMWEHSEPKR